MSAHAILAPSSAPQWGHCSGYIAATAGDVSVDTPDTLEGTATHWLAIDKCLGQWRQETSPVPYCQDWLGVTAPNGVVIDQKMVDGAQTLVDDVLAVCQQHGGLRQLLLEHRVSMPQIHAENWGTLDVGLVLLSLGLVYLWDYKHGHRDVRAAEHMQFIDYVAGLAHEYDIDGALDQEITVVIRVVHPFAYSARGPIDEWRVTLSDLRPYFNRLERQAAEAFSNPTFTTGVHCRDCTALGDCAAARKSKYNLIEYVRHPFEIDRMSARDLAIERQILKDGEAVLKARREAIEDSLRYLISQGDTDSGLMLETVPGRVKWSIPPDQAYALCQQFGLDIKTDVWTPTQVRDRLPRERKEMWDQVSKTVTTRSAGALNLIPTSESRFARAFITNK